MDQALRIEDMDQALRIGDMAQALRIGDAATRSGVTRDTIRFYERAGLLNAPARTSARHRTYDGKTLKRIRLVRQLQNCGLTISDIKEILFLDGADRPVASKRLIEVLRRRLIFLEERISSMEVCRERLIDVLREVAAARSAGYGVLDKLPDEDLPALFRFGRRRKDS